MDKMINHTVAYTVNKGDITKVSAEVDPDTNTYVLIHELAHAYDPKY